MVEEVVMVMVVAALPRQARKKIADTLISRKNEGSPAPTPPCLPVQVEDPPRVLKESWSGPTD